MAESANGWLGDDARAMNPLHLYQQYLLHLAENFDARRKKSAMWKDDDPVPVRRRELEERAKKSRAYQVLFWMVAPFFTADNLR